MRCPWNWWRLASLVMLVLPSLSIGQVASAAAQDESVSAAGLLIDTGDGEPVTVVVTFQGDSMPAVDVLRSANVGAVTVEFGGLGEAVCEIVEVGCDVSSCRQRVCQTGDPESPFWQFWTLDDEGAWSLSPLGASHVTMEHQDIGAWVWTGVEPDLDPTSWETLASNTGAPDGVLAGEPERVDAVFTSADPGTSEPESNSQDVLMAAAVVAVVAIAGGALVWRQRRVAGEVA